MRIPGSARRPKDTRTWRPSTLAWKNAGAARNGHSLSDPDRALRAGYRYIATGDLRREIGPIKPKNANDFNESAAVIDV